MAIVRVFDPYAVSLSLLVGSVGFGMTFFFNTDVASWRMREIAYPAMAMIYVYIRNARFFETDKEASEQLLGGSSDSDAKTVTTAGEPLRAPLLEAPGLRLVMGTPPAAQEQGKLVVVFFFGTWCPNSKRCLPAILGTAARYAEEGIMFAGFTQESEDDLRYFVETYQRSLESVSLFADEEGVLTAGYQGAHGVKTIPHCYVVRGSAGDGLGTVEWHGHPTSLEGALAYALDSADREGDQ